MIGIGKCVSRKYRCTYVKFHRQTAPTGPGHHPRPNNATRPASSHPDDLLLGPPPMSVPSMSPTDPYTFNFPQIYDDTSQLGFSGAQDFASRYRAHAELLRRTGGTMFSSNSAASLAALYNDPQASPTWFSWPQDGSPDLNNLPSGPGGQMQDQSLSTQFLVDDKTGILEKDMQAAIARHNYDRETGQFNENGGGTYSHGIYGRHRSESLDHGSDSGSGAHSVPSSAASSNIHLPLDRGAAPHQMYHVGMKDHQ